MSKTFKEVRKSLKEAKESVAVVVYNPRNPDKTEYYNKKYTQADLSGSKAVRVELDSYTGLYYIYVKGISNPIGSIGPDLSEEASLQEAKKDVHPLAEDLRKYAKQIEKLGDSGLWDVKGRTEFNNILRELQADIKTYKLMHGGKASKRY